MIETEDDATNASAVFKDMKDVFRLDCWPAFSTLASNIGKWNVVTKV
jgi:hypothetical protein